MLLRSIAYKYRSNRTHLYAPENFQMLVLRFRYDTLFFWGGGHIYSSRVPWGGLRTSLGKRDWRNQCATETGRCKIIVHTTLVNTNRLNTIVWQAYSTTTKTRGIWQVGRKNTCFFDRWQYVVPFCFRREWLVHLGRNVSLPGSISQGCFPTSRESQCWSTSATGGTHSIKINGGWTK